MQSVSQMKDDLESTDFYWQKVSIHITQIPSKNVDLQIAVPSQERKMRINEKSLFQKSSWHYI